MSVRSSVFAPPALMRRVALGELTLVDSGSRLNVPATDDGVGITAALTGGWSATSVGSCPNWTVPIASIFPKLNIAKIWNLSLLLVVTTPFGNSDDAFLAFGVSGNNAPTPLTGASCFGQGGKVTWAAATITPAAYKISAGVGSVTASGSASTAIRHMAYNPSRYGIGSTGCWGVTDLSPIDGNFVNMVAGFAVENSARVIYGTAPAIWLAAGRSASTAGVVTSKFALWAALSEPAALG